MKTRALPNRNQILFVIAGATFPVSIASAAQARWIENLGQWPARVEFSAQLPGRLAWVEQDALALRLSAGAGDVVVRLAFEGASPAARWSGEQPLEGLHHYFLGDDPSQWRRNARAFGRLRCSELYPGIDLVLRESDAGLKYDLLVDAGADLGALRVRCEGFDSLTSADGETVELATLLGPLLHQDGAAWQELPGGGQRPVECRWRALEGGTLAVECPERDPALPLVIDPELIWSTYLGASTYLSTGDAAEAVGLDAEGNVYVAGHTDGPDFPQTPGAVQRPGTTATFNIFVTKLRASDAALMYSSVLGGSLGQQRTEDMAVDASGQATVVGWTTTDNFPVTPGAFDTVRGSGWHAGFVTRLSTDGDELVFSTYLEGETAGADPAAVAVDLGGRTVVAGAVGPEGFPVTPGALDETFGGGYTDGFVSVLDPTGSHLEWSTYLGAEGADLVYALATTSDGGVVAAGFTASMEFPTTPGAFMEEKPSIWSHIAFVSRISPNGDSLIWSTYLGGVGGNSESDIPWAVSIDAFESVTVGGTTTSPTFPTTPGVFQRHMPSVDGGGFLTRFAPDGGSLLYSTYLGSVRGSEVRGLEVDSSGLATVSGTTETRFPTTPGAYDTDDEGTGVIDLFVSRLSPRGDRLFYASYLGGPNSELNKDVSTSRTGRTATVGSVYWPGGYPTTPGAPFPQYLGGQTDAVVTTLDLLLEGVEAYGESTPACLGPLRIGVTEMPVAGAETFSLYCSCAPPDADGWLLVSTSPAPLLGADEGQARLWIDPSRLLRRIPVRTDAFGYVETLQPLPPDPAGQELHVQYLFVNTPGCPGSTTNCSSPALKLTVQP